MRLGALHEESELHRVIVHDLALTHVRTRDPETTRSPSVRGPRGPISRIPSDGRHSIARAAVRLRACLVAGEMREVVRFATGERRAPRHNVRCATPTRPTPSSNTYRDRGSLDFAIADELRRKARGAATFAGGAAQNEGIPAILHDRTRLALPVRARDLGDRLKSQNAACCCSAYYMIIYNLKYICDRVNAGHIHVHIRIF